MTRLSIEQYRETKRQLLKQFDEHIKMQAYLAKMFEKATKDAHSCLIAASKVDKKIEQLLNEPDLKVIHGGKEEAKV